VAEICFAFIEIETAYGPDILMSIALVAFATAPVVNMSKRIPDA
jgi:hypothetical protein